MKVLKLNTTIHCEGCVRKIAPHFDQSSEISNWSVDLNDLNKKLIVQGQGVTVSHVQQLLSLEGYDILQPEKNEGLSFWADRGQWKRASFNTLNCLLGCSIGDFGMILFLQAYYPRVGMAGQMVLAIIAGLCTSIALESVLLKIREKFNWLSALKTAFGMSFISMVGMEIAMNITDFVITGGKADFDDPMYWTALLFALVAGFAAPLPYNYYKLRKYNRSCH